MVGPSELWTHDGASEKSVSAIPNSAYWTTPAK